MYLSRNLIYASLGVALVLALATAVPAQKRVKPAKNPDKQEQEAAAVAESRSVVRSTLVLSLRPPRRLPSFSPEREAAALHFVEEHHAELASLLIQLRENSPEEYRQAIRELFWTTEALALINDRDPDRYELEVQAWKNQSRLQLLAARLSMFENAGVEKELRKAVEQQIEIQVKLLRHERDRQKAQLQRADENLKSAQSRRQENADRRFKVLLKNIEKSRKSAQTASANEKSDRGNPRD